MPQMKFPIPERDTDLEGLKGIVAQYSKTLSWLLRNLDWTNVTSPITYEQIKKPENNNTMIDEYGINPAFLERYNRCWNSSFEVFDSTTLVPKYWQGGVADPDSYYDNNYSMKIASGGIASQVQDAGVGMADPEWWGNGNTRISFRVKGGAFSVAVIRLSDDSPLVITDNSDTNNPVSGLYLSYSAASDWFTVSFYLVNPAGTGKIYISINNTSATDVYIDAVQIEPDYTGKWRGLYRDGPMSVASPVSGGDGIIEYSIAEFNSAGVEFVLENGYVDMPIPSATIIGGNNKYPAITFTQETISETLCYSKITVVPEAGSTGTFITLSAICGGTAVLKP